MEVEKRILKRCSSKCRHQTDPDWDYYGSHSCTHTEEYVVYDYDYKDEINSALSGVEHSFNHVDYSRCSNRVGLYSDKIGQININISSGMSAERVRKNINKALQGKADKILAEKV